MTERNRTGILLCELPGMRSGLVFAEKMKGLYKCISPFFAYIDSALKN